MNHPVTWSLLLLMSCSLMGCGESTTPTPASDQSEVEKWVSENPAPPPTPVDEETF